LLSINLIGGRPAESCNQKRTAQIMESLIYPDETINLYYMQLRKAFEKTQKKE